MERYPSIDEVKPRVGAALAGSRDAVGLRRALRVGELTCRELAEAFLAACDGDELAAWAAIDGDALLRRAGELDRLGAAERERLPLFGVPVGVKDNFDTAGLPTAYGSPIYAGHRPRSDAVAVQRLLRAGALVAGKTKCSEFAWMTATDTLNPLDRTADSGRLVERIGDRGRRGPGGDRNRDADRRVDQPAGVLLRRDRLQGQLRPPAARRRQADGADTRHGRPARPQRARHQGGGELLATATEGPPVDLAADVGERPRLAFARTSDWARVEPAARAAIEDVARAARAAGGRVEDVELPCGFWRLVAAQEVIQDVESAASLSGELASHGEQMSDALRGALDRGAQTSDAVYAEARRAVGDVGPALIALLGGYDGVLTPSTTGTPPVGLDFTGDPRFCRAWTLLGGPCVSVPVAWTPAALPVGLQLVGAPLTDARTLASAEWLVDLFRA